MHRIEISHNLLANDSAKFRVINQGAFWEELQNLLERTAVAVLGPHPIDKHIGAPENLQIRLREQGGDDRAADEMEFTVEINSDLFRPASGPLVTKEFYQQTLSERLAKFLPPWVSFSVWVWEINGVYSRTKGKNRQSPYFGTSVS
jgi:hypothetical protein